MIIPFAFFSFYFIFLFLFSTFFYFDAEFFLSVSAFFIFMIIIAIFNSYSDSLIAERYNVYKNSLEVSSEFLTTLDNYTTSVTVHFEDISELIFYFSNFQDFFDEKFERFDDEIILTSRLRKSFKSLLFFMLQNEDNEELNTLIFELESSTMLFLDKYNPETYMFKKQIFTNDIEINIWFYEPRSLKQIYVARAIKPEDYIMPEWAYYDL